MAAGREQEATAGSGALEDSPAARWLVPFVGSSQRAPWVVVPFVDDEIPPARALAAAIGHLASYLAKKNLRRRDLRLNPNRVELGPHIARLAWARESKASHPVSALRGAPAPPPS